jgi:hypothetical protein
MKKGEFFTVERQDQKCTQDTNLTSFKHIFKVQLTY